MSNLSHLQPPHPGVGDAEILGIVNNFVLTPPGLLELSWRGKTVSKPTAEEFRYKIGKIPTLTVEYYSLFAT